MGLKETFIQNLKRYRKACGLSQMKLAEQLDSSTSYIGQIEIGNKFPSIFMIEKMAKALGIKPYLFFVDEEDSAPPPRSENGRKKPYRIPNEIKGGLTEQLVAAIKRVMKKA